MSFIRGVIDRLTTGNGAKAIVFGDEVEVERFGVYGLFTHPKKGCQMIMMRRGDTFMVMGEREKSIKITLGEGDVCLSDGVNRVLLKGDQGIEIISGGMVSIGGGNLQKLVTESFLTAFDTHIHPTTSLGAPTGVPANPSSINPTIKTATLEAS